MQSYYTVSGVNVILMVWRAIEKVDFQPRLGMLTAAFRACSEDLFHFFIVLLFVFTAYSAMGRARLPACPQAPAWIDVLRRQC